MKRKAEPAGDRGQRSIASFFPRLLGSQERPTSSAPKVGQRQQCDAAAGGVSAEAKTHQLDTTNRPCQVASGPDLPARSALCKPLASTASQQEQQHPNMCGGLPCSSIAPVVQQRQQQQAQQPATAAELSHADVRMKAVTPEAPAEARGSERSAMATGSGIAQAQQQQQQQQQRPQVDNSGENEYERQRAERIRRNQAVMRAMGLGLGPSSRPKKAAATSRQAAQRRPNREPQRSGPLRRSSRQAGGSRGSGGIAGAEDASGMAAAATAAAAVPEPALVYDDSSVARYVCEVLASANGSSSSSSSLGRDPGSSHEIAGFAQLPGCLYDPALPQAYSLDHRPGLVLAGGKGGVVSVWGSRGLESGSLSAEEAGEGVAPLLSHKLHRGWVADVQFVSNDSTSAAGFESRAEAHGGAAAAAGDASLLFLTASNDGLLALWDASKAVQQGRGCVPQCVAQAADVHSGGIFSMTELGHTVATASKDCTVALTRLLPSGSLALQQRYDALHEQVVKCVRWRQADAGMQVFGSCGNDRRICVMDSRQAAGSKPSLLLEDVHGSVINCLRWHPSNANLLLSTSNDPHILVHDLRHTAQPLFTLLGHSPLQRLGAIYQPCFVAAGEAIATGGERSSLLSLYCCSTGATISRGAVDINIHAMACGEGRGGPLLCSTTKAVYFLSPTWRPHGQ